MESSVNRENNQSLFVKRVRVKHSESFFVAVVLALFMLFYYYFTLFTENVDGAWTGVIVIFLTFAIDFFIFYLLFKNKLLVGKSVKITLIFLSLSVISYFVTFSGVHRLLLLIMILFGAYLFVKIPVGFQEAKQLFWLYSVIIILILVNTATGKENALETNKFNPNSGGFLLTLLFCASVILAYKHKDINKLPYCLISIITFGLQFVFLSRTALFGIILFLVLLVLFRATKKTASFRFAFLSLFILSLAGVLVAYVYSEIMYPAIGHGKIIIFGKDIFSGRQTIWHFAFNSIKNNFWFGVGSHLNETQFNEGYYELIMNAHNQPIGILAACGIFIFIIFYYALSYFVASLYKSKKANEVKYNKIPLIFMLVITVMSFFDIYFMSLYNILPILLMFCILTGLGRLNYNGASKCK